VNVAYQRNLSACRRFASSGIGTVLQAQWSGLRIQVEERHTPLQKRADWLWGRPNLMFSGHRRSLPGVKRSGVEVNHSPPSTTVRTL